MKEEIFVGIDLGTSNSALAVFTAEETKPRILPIPQINAPATVVEKELLASVCYLPNKHEYSPGSFFLEWDKEGSPEKGYVVGEYARERGALVPDRVITSAKSWLCSSQIDPQDRILPWESEIEGKKSPVEISQIYLEHLNIAFKNSLGEMAPRVVLTVPASFDDLARKYTFEAAQKAGWGEVTLLEEPQAAFYAWLAQSEEEWSKYIKPGDIVLVCDVGGGTADFSLIGVGEKDGLLQLDRLSVGDHILLGGDNMDLALAYALQGELEQQSERLDRWQFNALVHQARKAKERLLADLSVDFVHVSIPARGASLFAKSVTLKVTRSLVDSVLLEGFFALTEIEDLPQRKPNVGLKQEGLQYAFDPVFSKHLAQFLIQSRNTIVSSDKSISAIDLDQIESNLYVKPTAVLFNGGVFKSVLLRKRVIELLQSWDEAETSRINELVSTDLDLAVALGGAYYARTTYTGKGIRIRSSTARSYYLGLETATLAVPGVVPTRKGLCILPHGTEEGKKLRIEEQKFKLLVNQPVRFDLYFSATRAEDTSGELLEIDQEKFKLLPSIQTVLSLPPTLAMPRSGELDVVIEAELNSLGILCISCIHLDKNQQEHRWNLDFNLRKEAEIIQPIPGESSFEPGIDPVKKALAAEAIQYFYGKKKSTQLSGQLNLESSPGALVKELERIFAQKREDWDVVLLRELWGLLEPGMTRRSRSLAHETAWLYLAGFVLRPGYGSELDPFRIAELWRSFELGLFFPKEKSSIVQWWIMWRRVAGGVDRFKQELLFQSAQNALDKKLIDEAEIIRFMGSLERLGLSRKLEFGELLIQEILTGKVQNDKHYFWALERLIGRTLLYAEDEFILPAESVEKWYRQLVHLDWCQGAYQELVEVFAQGCRKTGKSEIDINPRLREEVVNKLKLSKASSDQLNLLENIVVLDQMEKVKLFGESLPSGLRFYFQ